jgi:hypothetical protein
LVSWTALLGLMLALPALARAAEEKADKPAIILRLAALDNVRADFRYLAKVVGQEEKAKQLDEMLKARIGDKGLEGIDPKKPIGAYGSVGRMGIDSTLVVLVPVADQKAFLGLLESFDIKPEKGKDEVYTVNHEKVPAPIYFRFANNYAYITVRDKDALDKDKLLAPAAVLPADGVGMMSLTVNVDQIPDNIKELALGRLDLELANAKDKEAPNETEAQKKFRLAFIDEVGADIKSVFNNGGETTLRLDVDRTTTDLALSLSMAGKAGSPLATTIKDLGQTKSATASLVHVDSAMNGALRLSLPPKLRKLLVPVIEEGEKKAIAKEADKSKREAVAALLEALRPTLQNAELDVAADLRGPNESGLYTAVAGIKVKDGAAIDKTFRRIVGDLPADQRKGVVFDVEKVGSVGIHRVQPEKNDENSKQLFGENPVYFAVREDAMLIGLGEKGLGALKEALAVEPKASKVMEIQMSMSKLAPLMVKDNKSAPSIAKKVFAKEPDGDKIRISLEGGSMLKLRLSMKAQLLAFFNELQQAKKGDQ